MAEVEAKVLEEIRLQLVEINDVSAASAVRLSVQARGRADLRSVLDELARAEKAVGAMAVQLAEGVLSPAAYASGSALLEERLGALRLRKQAAEAAMVDDLDVEAARHLAAALLELWPSMTTKDRNSALRTHVDRVIVRRQEYRQEPVADRTTVHLKSRVLGT